MLLLLDNHDSFTFNLVHAFRGLGVEVEVVASDRIDRAGIEARRPGFLVVGPGPGAPHGLSVEAFSAFAGRLPLLGVCLGHQALGVAFGAEVVRGCKPVHGRSSPLLHDGAALFSGLPQGVPVGRYHSLALDRATLPSSLRACASSADDGALQAVRHESHPTFGLQFHPESILTPDGVSMLRRFLELGSAARAA